MSDITKRIFYFDEIRALAILLIVLVHTSKWFINQQPDPSIYRLFVSLVSNFGNLGVQLFFMISGALILGRKYTISDFLKKRFSRILIPFIFWITVIIIIKIFVLGHSSTLEGIIDIIFFEGHIWFVWTIIGLYLFAPVINSYINQYNAYGCEFYLLIWFFTTILVSFKLYPIKNVELSYFAGFMGYMVLGWYLSNKKFKSVTDKSMMIIGTVLFLASTLMAFYMVYNRISFGSTYKLCTVPLLQATGIYITIKYAADYSEMNTASFTNRIYSFLKDSFLGRAIFSLSICSYGIYLIHNIPIGLIQLIDKTIPIFSRNPFKWEPILFIIVLLFSWGVIWGLSKVPHLKKITGT